MDPSDDYLTLDETADLLRISRTRTRQLIREGKLEATREGRRLRVTRASVYARIGEQVTPPGVQRMLYFARHFRDLTSVDPAKAGRWDMRRHWPKSRLRCSAPGRLSRTVTSSGWLLSMSCKRVGLETGMGSTVPGRTSTLS